MYKKNEKNGPKSALSTSALSYLSALKESSEALRKAPDAPQTNHPSGNKPPLHRETSLQKGSSLESSVYDEHVVFDLSDLSEDSSAASTVFNQNESLMSSKGSGMLPRTTSITPAMNTMKALRRLRNSIDATLFQQPAKEKEKSTKRRLSSELRSETRLEYETQRTEPEDKPSTALLLASMDKKKSPFVGFIASGSSSAESIDFEEETINQGGKLTDRSIKSKESSKNSNLSSINQESSSSSSKQSSSQSSESQSESESSTNSSSSTSSETSKSTKSSKKSSIQSERSENSTPKAKLASPKVESHRLSPPKMEEIVDKISELSSLRSESTLKSQKSIEEIKNQPKIDEKPSEELKKTEKKPRNAEPERIVAKKIENDRRNRRNERKSLIREVPITEPEDSSYFSNRSDHQPQKEKRRKSKTRSRSQPSTTHCHCCRYREDYDWNPYVSSMVSDMVKTHISLLRELASDEWSAVQRWQNTIHQVARYRDSLTANQLRDIINDRVQKSQSTHLFNRL